MEAMTGFMLSLYVELELLIEGDTGLGLLQLER
jgi:hypothetical protein